MWWHPVLRLLVAAPVVRASYKIHSDYDAYNGGKFGTFPSNTYHSTQETTPQLQINTWDKEAVSNQSHIFLSYDSPASYRHPDSDSNDASLGSSPLILRTSDFSPVYANKSFEGVANVKVHHYNKKPILSFYGGPIEKDAQIGNGWIYGYDQDYTEIGQTAAQNLKVTADMHEFIMTGPKTAIVTAYETTSWEDDQFLLDSVFQEINLDTTEVLFQWRASDHIDTKFSHWPKDADQNPYGWDFFHITSVQKSRKGDYLVSGSHMHSIYLIDGKTGKPKWTLGGQANDFTEVVNNNFTSPLLTFSWQHHATFVPGTDEKQLTFFDNHIRSQNGIGCTANCSRGLHVRLETHAKRAHIVAEYLHPSGLWSAAGGSVQKLANGNVFISWGRQPSLTEHLSNGSVVMDLQLSPWRSQRTHWKGREGSYRAFKWDWHATPKHWAPSMYVVRGSRDGSLTAYASWNGATDVVGWALLGAGQERELDGADRVLAWASSRGGEVVGEQGFETKMWVARFNRANRYLRVVAVGEGGRVLGASKLWDTMTGKSKDEVVPVTSVGEWKDEALAVGKGTPTVVKKPGKKGEGEWSWGAMLGETVVVLLVIYGFVKWYGK